VIRGGSWRNDASYVHSASRFRYDKNVRYLLNGFRVAKSLD
jgi:formylglycine-generating enzyme required for sulfatase activity